MKRPVEFQRRHFELIAELLCDGGKSARLTKKQWVALLYRFTQRLGGTNPQFDPERFMARAMGSPAPKRERRKRKVTIRPPAPLKKPRHLYSVPQ